ncbi:MAG: LysE family translocator [Alphaproteobacteria bacterium]|nr:LysE family translocator [Alphaproteobacteria bacterium]MBL6951243.1 LysE family translocator [Alphaproteobacteria bacterium]
MEAHFILISVFGIFIPALILPGPDFVAVVRSSMTRGIRAGLWTTLGVSICLGLYAALSLLGLSAVLVRYQWLAWAVRLLGASYLIYLGLRLIFSKSEAPEIAGRDGMGTRGSFRFGFFVTLTNPKAIVLFTSVFATSVTAATPIWLMLLMIGLVFAAALIWYAIVSVFMSSTPVRRRFTRARHWIERAAGVVFVGIGGRILVDTRNPIF